MALFPAGAVSSDNNENAVIDPKSGEANNLLSGAEGVTAAADEKCCLSTTNKLKNYLITLR